MNANSAVDRTLVVSLALALAGLVNSLALASELDAWNPAVNLSGMPGRSAQATLAHNPTTGDLFVAWMDNGGPEREEIMGRRWDQTTRAWLPALDVPAGNVSQSDWADGGPALVFDRHGHGLLLWTRRYAASQGAPADGTDLMWRSWEGATWASEAVLMHADTYLPGTYGLIPVETPDAILLFITWGNGYRKTEFRNGGWSEVTPWEYLEYPDLGVRPILGDIIMDDGGLLHAAAYGRNSSQKDYDRWFYDAYYLAYDGTNWTQPVNLSSTNGVVHDLGMAFDAQGRLHFLWSDPDSFYSSESLKSAIWQRVYENGNWTPNTEVTVYGADQAINGFSLTADVTGTLHLAWSEGIVVDGAHTNLGIYYQTGDGSIWGPEEEVYTSSSDSRYPVLAVGDHGASLIWQEGSILDRDIYFSRQASVPPEPCWIYLPLVSR